MKVVKLADKSGFCFGVKRAFNLALKTKEESEDKIYTLGTLIHNAQAVEFLQSKGIEPIELEYIDNIPKESTVIIRAHGVPPKTIETLKNQNFNVIDATCPYVIKIQKKAEEFYNKGYEIVVLGDAVHPEIIGINGWCNDKASIVKADNIEIEEKIKGKKVCLLSQTTEKYENWQTLNNFVEKVGCEFEAFNTICSATTERQNSALELSEKVDLMIIIGGKHSSNTVKLAELCKKNCVNTIHIESAEDITESICELKHIETIGVTAGASTPDWIIEEVINKMNNVMVNEQLEYLEKNDSQLFVGKKIKGEVVLVSDDEVVVNLNYKVDGVIPRREAVSSDFEGSLKSVFEEGQEIDAKVINMKNSDGCVVLSRNELIMEKFFNELEEAFNNHQPINVTIKEHIKGGLLASYNGVRVFIPASQTGIRSMAKLSSLVNKEETIYLMEFSIKNRGNKIIGSIKEYNDETLSHKEEEAWSSLEEDTVVKGIVKRITNFGAFVEVNGIDGLVHISELSWGKVNDIKSILKLESEVDVYVLKVDKENRKLSLSLKKVSGDPWQNVEEKYPVGSVVQGKVVRIADFGAFVELENGIDALVHISQISPKRISKVNEVLEVGQEIKAKITSVDEKSRKVGISIKELGTI